MAALCWVVVKEGDGSDPAGHREDEDVELEHAVALLLKAASATAMFVPPHLLQPLLVAVDRAVSCCHLSTVGRCSKVAVVRSYWPPC